MEILIEVLDQLGILGIVVAVILLTLVIFGKSIEKLMNDKKPEIQFKVKVLEIDRKLSGRFYTGRYGGYNCNPRYGITYELPNGKQKFKSAPLPEYEWVKEGDEGILVLQGTRFISFKKWTALKK